MSLVYDQDILIVWKNQYYHLPAETWKNLPAQPLSSDERVLSLVANGACVASLPNLPVDTQSNLGATCFMLNLDALKGGE